MRLKKTKEQNAQIKKCFKIEMQSCESKQHGIIRVARRIGISEATVRNALNNL